jgi:REP element-mobilizing transposase RayT
MSRSRYRIFETGEAYFLTCTIVAWLPVFTRPESAKVVFDSWRYLSDNRELKIYGYVILENHLHFVASGPDLGETVGDFKSYTARRIIDLLETSNAQTILSQLKYWKEAHKTDREHQFWQEGSHPKQIQGDAMMRQKLEYMHNNPVRRGYVDEPVHWRNSSARNYAGMVGLFPVITDWA